MYVCKHILTHATYTSSPLHISLFSNGLLFKQITSAAVKKHTQTHAHIHTPTHPHIHMYRHTYAYTHPHTHTYTQAHTHIYACILEVSTHQYMLYIL